MFVNIYDIGYELCGNELISLLFENQEIRRLWPEYNKESKQPGKNYGLYVYEDNEGFSQLSVGKSVPSLKPVQTYKSFLKGREALAELITKFDLCFKRCGIQKTNCITCNMGCHWEKNVEKYNLLVEKALEKAKLTRNMLIIGNGRNTEENSVVQIERGEILGFGFISNDVSISNPEDVKDYLQRIEDNPDAHKIIERWLKKEKPNNIRIY